MTKFEVAEVDSFTVGILRTVVAGLICLVVALVIGLSLPKTASAWLLMGFSVSRCYIGFPVLFTLGQTETTTSHVALIIAIMPVLMGLFAALTELRMPVQGWWIGSSTAFLGVAFLVGARFGFGGSGEPQSHAGRPTLQHTPSYMLAAQLSDVRPGFVAGSAAALPGLGGRRSTSMPPLPPGAPQR